jgi:glutamate--cysteine ligase
MTINVIKSLVKNDKKINEWFKIKLDTLYEFISHPKNLFPIYSSVDIRESYFKVAPVDVNLFPSGFNNFVSNGDAPKELQKLFIQYFAKYFGSQINGMKIALVVENFTRNKKYLENINTLESILHKCGASVAIYTVDDKGLTIMPFNDTQHSSWPFEISDIVILNNDLSIAIPPLLLEMKSKVTPNPIYGWYRRRKSIHLAYYNNLVTELCNDINLEFDPWFLSTYIDSYQNVNFKDKTGLEDLSFKVKDMLEKIEKKYHEHNINDITPYVFIKADGGTFGLGIMTASSPDDVININKKTRHSIHTLKQGLNNNDVIIQEGVPTAFTFNNSNEKLPAEHIIYSIGEEVAGILLRYNINKNQNQNLNSPGMQIAFTSKIPSAIEKLIVKLSNIAVMLEGSML